MKNYATETFWFETGNNTRNVVKCLKRKGLTHKSIKKGEVIKTERKYRRDLFGVWGMHTDKTLAQKDGVLVDGNTAIFILLTYFGKYTPVNLDRKWRYPEKKTKTKKPRRMIVTGKRTIDLDAIGGYVN